MEADPPAVRFVPPREPTLEVQLGYAGTLIAIGTALAWFNLDELRASGLPTPTHLILAGLGTVLLQMLVLDLSWFVALRGMWMASELRGRADPKNASDPTFLARMERLNEVGSGRFYLALHHGVQGTLWLLAAFGIWMSLDFPRWLQYPIVLLCLMPAVTLSADRLLRRRSRPWREWIHPRIQALHGWLGVHWVAPTYGLPPISLGRATLRRLFAIFLLLVNLVYVLQARLVPEQEVWRRSEGGEVVMRLHLGGLHPTASQVDAALVSETIPQQLLDENTWWMGDGVLLSLPVEALEPGEHAVRVERVSLRNERTNLTMSVDGSEARFIILDR